MTKTAQMRIEETVTMDPITAIIFFVIVGTSIWVGIDAKAIGARKGLVNGFLDMGPLGWALVCLLLWIVGFPLYLAYRGTIKKAAQAAAQAPVQGLRP